MLMVDDDIDVRQLRLVAHWAGIVSQLAVVSFIQNRLLRFAFTSSELTTG